MTLGLGASNPKRSDQVNAGSETSVDLRASVPAARRGGAAGGVRTVRVSAAGTFETVLHCRGLVEVVEASIASMEGKYTVTEAGGVRQVRIQWTSFNFN